MPQPDKPPKPKTRAEPRLEKQIKHGLGVERRAFQEIKKAERLLRKSKLT